MSAVPANLAHESVQRLQAAFAAHADHALPARQAAFAQFLAQGFPTTHQEAWKYTSLRRLEARAFATGPAVTRAPVVSSELAVHFVNGGCLTDLTSLNWPTGLRVRRLQEISSAERQSLLACDLYSTWPLAALNTALCNDGLVIEVAAQQQIDTPLLLNFGWQGTDSLMAHPRIIIRLAAHSRLTVIEHYHDTGNIAHWHNVVTEVLLDESAQLQHGRVQLENSASFHVGLLRANLAAQAHFTSHHVHFGAALARMDVDVRLNGRDAEAVLNGLQFAAGNQHHDTHTRVEHAVPHTRSHEDYRGIADQRGRVVFNGKVVVAKGARKTDAQQSSRNLLLANTAEIDTKPELEIYNDDVKCAHGATIGQLDANALFYLRSRGLSAAEARALLTHAFADHIIRQLPDESLQVQLTAASHARFGAPVDALS